MPDHSTTAALLRHLASRPGHDEVKSDFRDLLVAEFGVSLDDVRYEQRIEVSSRTDALVGRTIFEAKRNLDRELRDVETKMPDYLANREREEKQRFVGIASDGQKWIAYELREATLVKLSERVLDPDRADEFIAWLDGALALKKSLAPEPLTVRAELGRDSVVYLRAASELQSLWARVRTQPAVTLKRQLWAQLLKLVYGKEVESDSLFFQHTFLVIVAKAIAVAVLGVRELDPIRILSGKPFEERSITGAVESDFFDWVIADAAGARLVTLIVQQIRRFNLEQVKSDVLKVLYESLIDPQERHDLGEYYTPDWLAAKVVRHAVDRPLEQRVLDPACGSGTFLFHAVRNFLREAEEADLDPKRRASEATRFVAGMDIHPVSVIIARVTYLLALAPTLGSRAGEVSVPVYLGDAMQLSISQMLAGKELTIRVPPPSAGKSESGMPNGNGGDKLDFPETFCRDPVLFDKAIDLMRSASEDDLTRRQVEVRLNKITEEHYRTNVTPEQALAIEDLGNTYSVFDRLRREGRDSVWAYVARNLSRPLAFSASGGWANVVVGNPPWVAYRHMSEDLQRRFKELARAERVFVGGKLATQSDLSALFLVRAADLYLRAAGRIAFVMPLAALTRGQFEKLRSGSFSSVRLAFDQAWTMDDTLQPLFPVPSCVLFARKRAVGKRMPDSVRAYSGTLPNRDASEAVADSRLRVLEAAQAPSQVQFAGGSKYRGVFHDGATLYPRLLVLVERETESGPLGGSASRPLVRSRRSAQEKKPWKEKPSITAAVEAQFLRPLLLGESILPFRVFQPVEAVIPVDGTEVIDAKGAADRGYPGLFDWMRKAESMWDTTGSPGTTFVEQLNYYGKLETQFPLRRLRVVYAKAGTLPAASLVRTPELVVDHKLYWAPVETEDEGHYLCSILGSETARERVASMQSRGQWGARDFDKVMFNLPIPTFDAKNELHQQLARAGREAEAQAADVTIDPDTHFQRARRLVRDALAAAGLSAKIDGLVGELLDT